MPVAIRAASFWIFSNSSFSYWTQLSQTTSPYSRIGLMNEVYIVSRDLRSSLNLSFLITWTRAQALSLIYFICWCQDPSWEKCNPRCLCELTSLISWFCIKSGGWVGLSVFRVMIREFVLGDWNVTSHWSAQLSIFMRSDDSISADASGSVTAI